MKKKGRNKDGGARKGLRYFISGQSKVGGTDNDHKKKRRGRVSYKRNTRKPGGESQRKGSESEEKD